MSQDEAFFDVFISYNSLDREAVESLCREIEGRELRPFLDRKNLEPGVKWLETLTRHLLSCEFIICFGPNGLGPYQKQELEIALRKKERIFPVLLPNGTMPDDPLISYVEAYHFANITEIDRLAQAIHQSRNGKQPLAPESVASAEEVCPYQGLFPFNEENASFFFGRDDLIEDLVRAVEKDCMTALIGASGSGKSSVVRAGLLPRLQDNAGGMHWEAILMRPGPQPVHALTSALISFLKPTLTIEEKAKRARERASKILSGRDSLGSLIDQVLNFRAEAGAKRLLLFIDQWEELYTLTSQKQERSKFIDQILDVACRQGSPITVLLAIRIDFYKQVLRHSGLRAPNKTSCRLGSWPSQSFLTSYGPLSNPCYPLGSLVPKGGGLPFRIERF